MPLWSSLKQHFKIDSVLAENKGRKSEFLDLYVSEPNEMRVTFCHAPGDQVHLETHGSDIFVRIGGLSIKALPENYGVLYFHRLITEPHIRLTSIAVTNPALRNGWIFYPLSFISDIRFFIDETAICHKSLFRLLIMSFGYYYTFMKKIH